MSQMQTHAPPLARIISPATQFRCCDCEREFKSESALTDHLRYSRVHRPGTGPKISKGKRNKSNQQEQSLSQASCKECNKTFKNRSALTLHLSSVRHHPLSNIKCLAGAECKKRFNCPSGQLQHLESGKCCSGMTKTKLNVAIAANDTGRIITSRGNMTQQLRKDNLHASASSTSQTRSPILTPSSTEFLGSYPPSPVLTPENPLSARNFHSMLTLRLSTQDGLYTCHLCPPSRTRRFKSEALQHHLSSSVHAQVSISFPVVDDITFHCPRSLMGEASQKKSNKHFSTVSGLAQHLESGACNGGKGTFRRVIKYVQGEMKDMGFGGLKLLS